MSTIGRRDRNARQVAVTMTLSEEANTGAERLARGLGVRKGEVFAWALALLDLAYEAKQSGNSIGIIGPDGDIESIIDLS